MARYLIPPASGPWRYRQVGRTDPTNYSSPSYDDSSWATGSGVFRDSGGGTTWDLNTRIWIRRWLTLPRPSNLRFSFYADNAAVLYLDGVQIASIDNPAGTGQFTFDLLVPAGTWLLAGRGTDDEPFAIDAAVFDISVLDLTSGWLVGAAAAG